MVPRRRAARACDRNRRRTRCRVRCARMPRWAMARDRRFDDGSPLRTALGLLLWLACAGGPGSRAALAQDVPTFARDIAPLLYTHCATCHRPGEVGGFSLLSFADARPRAAAMARAVRTRAMPPWKPDSIPGCSTAGSRPERRRETPLICLRFPPSPRAGNSGRRISSCRCPSPSSSRPGAGHPAELRHPAALDRCSLRARTGIQTGQRESRASREYPGRSRKVRACP
jgi:hypothetical protein